MTAILTVVTAAVLGGLGLFMWNGVSWMMLPWHHWVYQGLADEDEVGAIVAKNCIADGVYGLPAAPVYQPSMDKAARVAVDEAVEEKLRQGPLVTIVFQRRGYTTLRPKLVRAVLTGMICALIYTVLLLLVGSRGDFGFWQRVGVVSLGALGAVTATRVPDWNWHGYSPRFVLVQIADTVIGSAIIGMIVAAVTLRMRS
jgi:hypothetical protein